MSFSDLFDSEFKLRTKVFASIVRGTYWEIFTRRKAF
jgi:hypothetical protein